MPTDTLNRAAGEFEKAAKTATAGGQEAFGDTLASAERSIIDAAKTAERAIREGAESLRAHTRAYTETAGEQVEDAQRYVVERVKARPMTATLAGLGVGVLLGLLLSNHQK